MELQVTSAVHETAEDLDRAGGRQMRLHLDSDATGGGLSVLTCALGAAHVGPPLHAHPASDESFVIVHTPGGFEQMHREVHAAEAAAARALSAPDIIPIAQRHDWVFAGPPLLPTGELAMAAGAEQ